MATKLCVDCNKDISNYKADKHKKCTNCRLPKVPCLDCSRPIRKGRSVCIACLNLKRVGVNNPNWRGGKTKHKAGYTMCHVPDHPRAIRNSGKYVFEHILVLEESLGRYLIDNEHVHHKNGVKDDNSLENLELWTGNHPTGSRVNDLINWSVKFLRQYSPGLLS